MICEEEHVHEDVYEEVHEGGNIGGEYPMHGAYPSQEGTLSQEEPPVWFLEYFKKINEPLGKIKQQQAEIIQTQKRHEEYMDRLGDLFHEQGKQQRSTRSTLTGSGILMQNYMSNKRTLIRNTPIGWLAWRLKWKRLDDG